MAAPGQVPFAVERGFTLIETAVAIAVLTAVVLASVVGLTHRGGEFQSDRAQVAAFLVMAKSHASTIAGGSGGTGATVVASYAAGSLEGTTLTLYDGRPFGGNAIAPTPRVAAVRIAGQLALASPAPLTSSSQFAIFFGASGATSALDRYVVNRTIVTTEPPCDRQTGVRMPFTLGSTSDAIQLSCETGEVIPPVAVQNQQRATLR